MKSIGTTSPKRKAPAAADATTDASSSKNVAKNNGAPITPQDASAAIEATLDAAARKAGVSREQFEKLPREERDAFLAEARGDQRIEARGGTFRMMDPRKLVRSSTNRTVEKDEAYHAMKENIREHGILQPLLVRTLPDARIEIVIGEHRWTAALELGLAEVPIIMRVMNDREAIVAQLSENMRRKNLKPLDEARGFQRMRDLGMSVEDIGRELGAGDRELSRATIYGRLKLLDLPEEAMAAVEKGTLPASHAELIARAATPQIAEKLTRHILNPEAYEDDENGILTFREAKEAADDANKDFEEEKKWLKQTEGFAAKGCKVLTLAQSAKVFNYGNLTAAYVDAKGECPGDAKKRSWKDVLGEHAPQIIIARNGSYGGDRSPVREVFSRKAVETAVTKHGIKLTLPQTREERQKIENEKSEREAAAKLARDSVAIEQIVAAAEAREFSADALRFIAAQIVGNRMWYMSGLLKRRGAVKEEEMSNLSNRHGVLRKAIEVALKAADGRRLRGLLVEILLWQGDRADEDALKKGRAVFGVQASVKRKGPAITTAVS